jgi:hypothetical protein
MSKFLLNLLLQISKALVYSKIKFYSEKNFPHFWPNRPSSQPAHPDFWPSRSLYFPFQPGVPPLPTGPRPLHRPSRPPSSSSRRPHGRPRCPPPEEKKQTAGSIPLHSPINQRHSPSSNTSNWHLQTGAIEAPSTPAIEGARPPPPRLRPIKGRPALGEDSHTFNAPSLSPQCALAVALPSRSSATGETPLHRLLSHGNPVIELACPSFPSPAPRSDLSSTGTARG